MTGQQAQEVVAIEELGPAPLPSAAGFGLDRPHFTDARVPSISTPAAQASAAFSAEALSVKLTNAQLFSPEVKPNAQSRVLLRLKQMQRPYRFFATWTTDLNAVGGTEGRDDTRAPRIDCSVADSGRDVRNRDV